MLKAIQNDNNNVKIDVLKYGVNLNDEELLDWIAALDNHFEYRGKVCKVFIDTGSQDNLVSKEMVDKLNLERIPHKAPY